MGLKVHQNLDTGPGTGSVIKNNVIMLKKKKKITWPRALQRKRVPKRKRERHPGACDPHPATATRRLESRRRQVSVRQGLRPLSPPPGSAAQARKGGALPPPRGHPENAGERPAAAGPPPSPLRLAWRAAGRFRLWPLVFEPPLPPPAGSPGRSRAWASQGPGLLLGTDRLGLEPAPAAWLGGCDIKLSPALSFERSLWL